MLKAENMAKRATAARWAGTFLRVLLCVRERLSPQASELEGDFHDTPRIEGGEALEGIEEMPHGGGVFFLEEFGIRGAAAFTDFLLDRGEELLSPLEYGVAAGISRTGIAQQGLESFGGIIEVALVFQQEGFSKSWLREVRIGLNRCLKMPHGAGLVSTLGRCSSKAVERVGIAGFQIKRLGEKADGRIPILLAGENIPKHDIAPSIIGSESQGIDELILGCGQIAEFIVEHGKVAARHWQGRIRGEGLCEKMERLLKVAALGLLRGLLRQPLSLAHFFSVRLSIFDTGCAIGDRDADISS